MCRYDDRWNPVAGITKRSIEQCHSFTTEYSAKPLVQTVSIRNFITASSGCFTSDLLQIHLEMLRQPCCFLNAAASGKAGHFEKIVTPLCIKYSSILH